MKYALRYLREWLRYTPVFFRFAPASHWPRYFTSCRRVVGSILYAQDQLAECEDVWQYGQRRGEMLRVAEEKVRERS